MIYWLSGGGNNWWQAGLSALALLLYGSGGVEDDCTHTASCPAHLY